MMKVICWFILVILMFFVSNKVISFYESMSKFGAGFFLLVQVVLLLDFVNNTWVGYDEQFWLVVDILAFICAFVMPLLILAFLYRTGAVIVLASSTVFWFLFERAGYSLLSFVSNVLLLLVAILFLWAKSASLLNRPLPPVPNMEMIWIMKVYSQDQMFLLKLFLLSQVISIFLRTSLKKLAMEDKILGVS